MRRLIFVLLLSIVLLGCNKHPNFDSYIGTYVPFNDVNLPIFTKIQIEKRGDLYILAGESYFSKGQSVLFFVCTKEGDHLSINPSKYLGENNDSDILLTEKTNIYFDDELSKIYFLNTIYTPTNKKIFEISGNDVKIIK